MRLDRISEDSRYSVTAEITIKTRQPGVPHHIHQARLNLTSSPARSTLTKILVDRVPLDWSSMLEQACVMVLEKHREGSPVIQLADHPMPEGLQFRLDPLLQERQAVLFFGEGDTGSKRDDREC